MKKKKQTKINWTLLIIFLFYLILFIGGIMLLALWLEPEPASFGRLPQIDMPKSKYAVLENIIKCESEENRLAENPNSSAVGIFQILDGTKELCERNLGRKIDRTEVEDSWICAKYLIDNWGLTPWQECVNILGLSDYE